MTRVPLAAAVGVALLVSLVGCGPIVTGPASPVPAVTTVVTVLAPEPEASLPPTSAPPPALGAWTPTCTSPDTDAAALVANLLTQPQFAVPLPSKVQGFHDAAASVVKPLVGCPVAHSLAVQLKATVTSDKAASMIVSDALSTMLRKVVLTLGGTKVGRFTIGKTGLAEAQPVLEAVLGQPTNVTTGTCPLSGYTGTKLTWGGLSIDFDATTSGKPIDSWELRPNGSQPANIEIAGGLPSSASLAQLKAFDPAITQLSVFDTGAGPWIATLKSGVRYVWLDSRTGASFAVGGGELRLCE